MARIVLIACASKKRRVPTPGKDLYISDLFRSSLAYAQKLRADAIYILSAKHGLVGLDQILEPYDQTLNVMKEPERKEWGERVLRQLKEKTDPEKDEFIFLAGMNYRKHLVPQLKHVQVPLQGLGIGKQLQELKRRVKSE